MSHKSISHDPHAVKQLAFQLDLTEDSLWDVVGRPIVVALDMNDQDESESDGEQNFWAAIEPLSITKKTQEQFYSGTDSADHHGFDGFGADATTPKSLGKKLSSRTRRQRNFNGQESSTVNHSGLSAQLSPHSVSSSINPSPMSGHAYTDPGDHIHRSPPDDNREESSLHLPSLGGEEEAGRLPQKVEAWAGMSPHSSRAAARVVEAKVDKFLQELSPTKANVLNEMYEISRSHNASGGARGAGASLYTGAGSGSSGRTLRYSTGVVGVGTDGSNLSDDMSHARAAAASTGVAKGVGRGAERRQRHTLNGEPEVHDRESSRVKRRTHQDGYHQNSQHVSTVRSK
mmetsp:Transcript_43033/g.116046  ORF Transcript_43033/g.116046 Transcript_43033/m.116046 type:complete len:344 (-) Transcript_43033:94-1125(-)